MANGKADVETWTEEQHRRYKKLVVYIDMELTNIVKHDHPIPFLLLHLDCTDHDPIISTNVSDEKLWRDAFIEIIMEFQKKIDRIKAILGPLADKE